MAYRELTDDERRLTPEQAKLAESNQPLVDWVYGRWFVQSFVEKDELISIGSLALMRAARTFDASMGFKFSTLAVRAIYRDMAHARSRQSKRSMKPFIESYGYPDHHDKPEIEANRALLCAAMEAAIQTLSEQEQQVIRRRHYREETCRVIADDMGVSFQRVSQIDKQARKKLRAFFPQTAEFMDCRKAG